MKTPAPLVLLCVLGCLAVGCLENRPIVVGDAGLPQQNGIAGTAGVSGASGRGAVTAAGLGGAGGYNPPYTCDMVHLINQKYSCTLIGACHDANGSAAGLNLTQAAWPKLVGTYPSTAGGLAFPSMCLAPGLPYLVKGTLPAQGLLLDKLKAPPPCGAQMPDIGGPVSLADMECFQAWANELTSGLGTAGISGTFDISGAAGSAGTAGVPGAAGSAGTAGGTPQAGGTGGQGGVTTARGCDVSALFGSPSQSSGGSHPPGKYYCTLAGACHDVSKSATGLDMLSPGWEQKLVGTFPSHGSLPIADSLCLDSTEPYLIKGSLPARGLFLDKFSVQPPCGQTMPSLPPLVSAEDMDCIQRWANALTTQ
jgi:hypothetical protein